MNAYDGNIQDGIQQLFMPIQQTAEELHLHSNQQKLTISCAEKMRKDSVHGIKLMLDSKGNNINPIKLTAKVEMEDEQLKTLYRKISFPRLQIHRHSPRITIHNLCMLLKDTTSTLTEKEISRVDEVINHWQKYWRKSEMRACISWPISLSMTSENNQGGQSMGKIPSSYFYSFELDGKSIHQLENGGEKSPKKNKQGINFFTKICEQLKGVAEERSLRIDEDISLIKTNNLLFPHLLLTTLRRKKQQWDVTRKEKLFRHIFLTQLAHMIINHFVRNKKNHHRYKDGRINYWYEDEYRKAMRSGYRLSEFRDHSVETFHPPDQCESSDTVKTKSNKKRKRRVKFQEVFEKQILKEERSSGEFYCNKWKRQKPYKQEEILPPSKHKPSSTLYNLLPQHIGHDGTCSLRMNYFWINSKLKDLFLILKKSIQGNHSSTKY